MPILMNVEPLQGERGQACSAQNQNPPLLLPPPHPRTLYLGSFLFLHKTNLSSLAEHISEEEEMEVLINIIKYWMD